MIKQCVLVLSCKRPEFTKLLVTCLLDGDNYDICIAVDKATDSSSAELRAEHEILERKFNSSRIHWLYRDRNFGIVNNLYSALDSIFQAYDICVVLEDDIKVGVSHLKSLFAKLKTPLPNHIMTVGLFGGLPCSMIPHRTNMWRLTPYFSAWGWGIKKEQWVNFRKATSSQDWSDYSFSSKYWQSLRMRSKNVWFYRFSKIKINPLFAWDYQFQHYSFKFQKYHLLPIYRANDNIGFSDPRSTNTKSRKPRWYCGTSCKHNIQDEVKSQSWQRIMVALDSLTWIGDSFFAQKYASFRRQSRRKRS